MKKTFLVALAVLLAHVAPAIAKSPAKYVAASACQACHQSEYEQWQKSDHAKAMAVASSHSVLGDFSGKEVKFHEISSRFFIKDSARGKQYFVKTLDASGSPQEFQILYTFGHYPLQQYLVEMDHGHLQALNVAWDSRAKEEGGQRWFHLQPDENITVNHPFYWSGHFQNWNSRCADCHSTNLIRNYNAQAHSYNTTFSEINVACEACHGAGSNHVALAGKDQLSSGNSGFSTSASANMVWRLAPGGRIAESQSNISQSELNMCGSCHSLRTPLQENSHDQSFVDSNRLQFIGSPTYFHDGQVREEAFVVGSFLQSKMHKKGVTCSNCHNPHSGEVRTKGNALCSQCHASPVFDNTSHHHHEPDSSGAQCVNCHMPERTIMQVDDRRDHSFTIPRPQHSIDLGVPNACTQCHAGKNDGWAKQELENWDVEASKDHWAYAHSRAEMSDVLVTRDLAAAVEDASNSDFVRASLLSQFAAMPSRVSVELAQKNLADKSSLIRSAAVSSLRNLPAQARWQILSPYLSDQSRLVRFELAAALLDIYLQMSTEQQASMAGLINEYRESLLLSADSPAGQIAIANLEFNLGNATKAEQALRHAIRIAPAYVPALLQLADFYRGSGRDDEAGSLLIKAIEVAPDSGAALHSYGLYLVRQKNYSGALPFLRRAVIQQDAQPRFAYVYAVALDNQGNTEGAVSALVEANERWPNQYDLLMTLVGYLHKAGKSEAALPYLSALTSIAPNDPRVKKLVMQLKAQ